MPRVSIITPTKNRQAFLPALWECVRNQSFSNIEWLIHDGSPQPAPMFAGIKDSRVRYMHTPQPMSIGAKRNDLCRAAKGEIIVHFDDDDFYGPHYVQNMIKFMTDQKADFVKLFGFFLYHQQHNALAYWDLEIDLPLHFILRPNNPPFPHPNKGHMSGLWGYGFSYVFRRTVWDAVSFPDRNHGEDEPFADAARQNFKAAGMRDFDHTCIHVIHANNTAVTYPQQLLPPQLLPGLFPDFRKGQGST
jgi:glycosyltransferase involved in cell wall biosynthesis